MDANPAAVLDHDEMLVAELHRLDVRHLVRLQPDMSYPALPPTELIAGLAGHRQARLRGALILLFLRRPSLSGLIPAALESLIVPAADTLRLYYQAAVYLRPELEAELKRFSDDLSPLPDRFSAELGLPAVGSVPAEAALAALGEVHARLSGRAYNWAGSYRQHLPLFLKQLKRPAHAELAGRAFSERPYADQSMRLQRNVIESRQPMLPPAGESVTIGVGFGRKKDERMARARTADQADQVMAHLADLADRHDEAGFASALQVIDWSSRPADEVLHAVQLASMTGAFMAARRLSQEGADRFPAHAELQRYARVLAPPKVIRSAGPPDLTLIADYDWIKREADAYRGQWIALHNGELLGTADTFDAHADQFPDPHGILLTKIF